MAERPDIAVIEQVARTVCTMIEKGMISVTQVQEQIKLTAEAYLQAFQRITKG